MVHVNYLAILVAAVAVFVLGWLWYSPLLFFKPWMRLRGMDPVAAMAGAKMPAGKLLIELVRCLVLACVIARLVALLGISSWMARSTSACCCGSGSRSSFSRDRSSGRTSPGRWPQSMPVTG